jgi:hypothetical protein
MALVLVTAKRGERRSWVTFPEYPRASMAKLIPALSSVAPRMTAGERRFAQRLESLLEPDYLCWYGVPVGSRALYPDFLIWRFPGAMV